MFTGNFTRRIKMKFKSTLIALSVASSGMASANVNNANFDFFEAGFIDMSPKQNAFNLEPNGYRIAASKRFQNLFASIQKTQTMDSQLNKQFSDEETFSNSVNTRAEVDIEQLQLTAGYIFDISDTQTFDISISYSDVTEEHKHRTDQVIVYADEKPANVTTDIGISEFDIDVYAINARYMYYYENIQLKVNVGGQRLEASDEDESAFVYGAELGYYFTESFSISVSYQDFDRYDTTGANVRYHF